MSAEPFVPEFESAERAEPHAHGVAPVQEHEGACPNCGRVMDEEYCPRCGQKRLHDGDLSLAHAWHHLFHEILHLDGRLLTTIKVLFTRPGQLSVDFLEGRRARHIHPIQLFLLFSTMFFLVQVTPAVGKGPSATSAGVAEARPAPPKTRAESPNAKAVERLLRGAAEKEGVSFELYLSRLGTAVKKYGVIATVIISGLWLSQIFRGRRRYLAEHMVVILHVVCVALAATWAANFMAIRLPLLSLSPYLALLAYYVLALRRVYNVSARETVPAVAITLFTYVGVMVFGPTVFGIYLAFRLM
jgi:hypothetical protein